VQRETSKGEGPVLEYDIQAERIQYDFLEAAKGNWGHHIQLSLAERALNQDQQT
jgi:hypothetical protein